MPSQVLKPGGPQSILNPRLAGLKVLVRGAGEMASGVAHRLARSGFRVLMTEVAGPLAVRRAVSFCEAVHDRRKTVEGITACWVQRREEVPSVWQRGELPVLIDPGMQCLKALGPQVIVDALLAKRNTGLHRDMATLTIGLGPGFVTPDDVHLAIETMRGHDLGRLIYQGSPSPDTGIPGEMAGYTHQRVLRAPKDGVFVTERQLGDKVMEGDLVAQVDSAEVVAQVSGILRGLIRSCTHVKTGLKVGDIDPRGKVEYLHTISDKARALGGSVLEGIMACFNQ